MKRRVINWIRNMSGRRVVCIVVALALCTFLAGIAPDYPGRNAVFVSFALLFHGFAFLVGWVSENYGTKEMDDVIFECESTIEYFQNEVNKIHRPELAKYPKIH